MNEKTLLVTVDSIRKDHQKYLENTSNFLEFENSPVFATAPSTYSSFHAILSSQYPKENGVNKTFVQRLNNHSIGITTNQFLKPRYGFNLGFDDFNYPNRTKGWKSKVGMFLETGSLKHQIASNIWSNIQIIKDNLPIFSVSRDFRGASSVIKEFKQKIDGKEEWFGWIHLMEPHHPYNPPTSEMKRSEAKSISRSVISGRYKDSESKKARQLYRKEIEWVDKKLQELWNFIPDETRVLFCADHGEHIGDQKWGHGGELVPDVLKVPMAYKNIDNKPSGDVVSLIDVPTVILGEKYRQGEFNREFAYATAGDKKAVFNSKGYVNGDGCSTYDGEEFHDQQLMKKYRTFDSKSPSRMSEGVEEDLEALGYIS